MIKFFCHAYESRNDRLFVRTRSKNLIIEYQQIEKFSDCRGTDTANGGETRLFPAGGAFCPGKKSRVSLPCRTQSGNSSIY
ncbi:Uncharacterized protein dnm_085870 [Desulfonema magnum]|uniref:Uncharacterized protein n=1 Tax=Desulfonema magnum TaxID=45655 RepID=A0A975BVZ3_9BACT|nr:Uncharacterized protein dnm_085870 [Desulfonema magnum]